MTAKDFNALAALVRAMTDNGKSDVAPDMLAETLALFCADRNPRFDRRRFLEACGVSRAP